MANPAPGTGVRFEITRRIGGGSFGEIFLGISPENEKVSESFQMKI